METSFLGPFQRTSQHWQAWLIFTLVSTSNLYAFSVPQCYSKKCCLFSLINVLFTMHPNTGKDDDSLSGTMPAEICALRDTANPPGLLEYLCDSSTTPKVVCSCCACPIWWIKLKNMYSLLDQHYTGIVYWHESFFFLHRIFSKQS